MCRVLCKAQPHGLLRTTLRGEIYYHPLAKGTSCEVSKVEEELARRRGGPWKGITQRKQYVQGQEAVYKKKSSLVLLRLKVPTVRGKR